jgi:opacity protein-like surface antigen
MMRLFAAALLVLGSVGVAGAQEMAPAEMNDNGMVAENFNATVARKATLIKSVAASDPFFAPPADLLNEPETPVFATALAVPLESADPARPSPKFVFGGRDDYRWQLALGLAWFRFRSSIFNASALGVRTSLNYFTNNWFGIEGSVSATFAPRIFAREHVKLLVYGAGPKIAWRQRRWEPWAHAIVGGAHELPQTIAGGRNAFGLELGGGADYRFNPRLSGRLEGNYVRTSFFGQTQTNLELAASIVFHF